MARTAGKAGNGHQRGSGNSKRKTSSSGQASRRKAAANPRRPLVAGWVTGLAMGLFVALLVHLEHTRPDPSTAPANGADSAAATAERDGEEGPRFEFYRLLSEQEVEVGGDRGASVENPGALPSAEEQDGDSGAAADAPDSEATSTAGDAGRDGERYLLQAGSFRRADDADALKANLALLGIEARIQVVELPGGETWHRVRIGPFGSLGAVNSVRERMASRQIESILLRAGG